MSDVTLGEIKGHQPMTSGQMVVVIRARAAGKPIECRALCGTACDHWTTTRPGQCDFQRFEYRIKKKEVFLNVYKHPIDGMSSFLHDSYESAHDASSGAFSYKGKCVLIAHKVLMEEG